MHVKKEGIKLTRREGQEHLENPDTSPIEVDTRIGSAINERAKDLAKEQSPSKIKKLQGKSLHLGLGEYLSGEEDSPGLAAREPATRKS